VPSGDKTLITQSLIKSIRVFRVGKDCNSFDPNRLTIDWRYDGVLVDLLPSLNAVLAQASP
jgi:hypothetical protein